MDRARAVIVGGGITGASVAYHLAKVGDERGPVHGSGHHVVAAEGHRPG
jgi:glycine/D-amino acid oxidase-like deaminating enzyme